MPNKPELRQAMSIRVKRDTIDRENRTMTIVASTPGVDRFRSIFLPSAFARWMPRYMQNPVICDNHQTWLPPVGRTLNYRISDVVEKDIQFARTAKGLEWFELYADEYANGWSVHGEAHDMVFWWEEDRFNILPGFARAALQSDQADYVITDFELWETSCATVPGNADTKTLRQAVAEGKISRDMARSLILPPAPRFGMTEELRALRESGRHINLDLQLRASDAEAVAASSPPDPQPEPDAPEESPEPEPAKEEERAVENPPAEPPKSLDPQAFSRALCAVLVERINDL